MRDLVSDAEDLGEADELDVIDRLVPVAGLNVVDVGCGDGRLTRQLAERGAEALGVEPDSIQAEKNRAAATVPGLSFVEAPGQALPIKDDFMDGVFFTYSLHHLPREHMDKALAEAMRVLKPDRFPYSMARIKLEDIPVLEDLDEEEVKGISGGNSSESADVTGVTAPTDLTDVEPNDETASTDGDHRLIKRWNC